ncbi:MAG: 16S rRNA (guanine(966)-N(2))-methyltransferase RsmD [Lachnospiraceae bacterium]|nr:16S rRNA (guanine(966)-N(2))-methyltransferase RsmD [Lachnospiraceae bacterium]
MRIIAGSKRRLPLKTIEGKDTRPTTDRIKETLFNMIQNEIPGSYFLDLFSGSGQIGLEALSRGSLYSVFVENNKKAAACIAENIRFTKSEKESLLLQMDVLPAMRSMEGKHKFDIIFMDPPYGKLLEQEVLEYLQNSSLLKEDALIIVEMALGTDYSYVKDLGYQILKEKQYKTNMHVFLTKEN